MKHGHLIAGAVLAVTTGCALEVGGAGTGEAVDARHEAVAAAPFDAVSAELVGDVKGGAVHDPQTGAYVAPSGMTKRAHEAPPGACGAARCLDASPAPQAPLFLTVEAFEVIRDWEPLPDGSFFDPATGETAGLVAGGLCHRIPCVEVLPY